MHIYYPSYILKGIVKSIIDLLKIGVQTFAREFCSLFFILGRGLGGYVAYDPNAYISHPTPWVVGRIIIKHIKK